MPDEALAEPLSDGADSMRRTLHAGLVLVATPIGNLGDLTPRAAQVLREAEVVIESCSPVLLHEAIASFRGV